MILSKRLKASVEYVKNYHCLADCGTDHGYLPIFACKHNLVQKAIASDNKTGPLENAKANIAAANLEDKISLVLADGLPYLDDSIDVVTILGMGGRLIADILKNANINYLKRLVLSPNSETKILRQCLMDLHFKIVEETMIEEKHKFYQIIVCEPGEMTLSELEKEFGPLIINKNSDAFKKYIHKLIQPLTEALPNIKSETESKNIIKRINLLKEVIA